MTVTLTEAQERFIADQLKTGHYGSPDEVVASSLALLRAQEDFISTNQMELREKIAEGLEDLRGGDLLDGPEAVQALRKKLQLRPGGG